VLKESVVFYVHCAVALQRLLVAAKMAKTKQNKSTLQPLCMVLDGRRARVERYGW
jgi:hypothetical protein